MVEIGRTVRFFLNRDGGGEDPPRHNGFAAWPPPQGLASFYQLHVVCRGRIDPVTGYFVNISEIDCAVRGAVLPVLRRRVASEARDLPLGRLMQEFLDCLRDPLGGTVVSVRLDLSPYLGLTIGADCMDKVIVSEEFEFAAAHRLHVDHLSEQENRRIFGKCNHPSGHGHNYRVVVSVAAPVDPEGHVPPVARLDEIVDRHVIQKLDHKHLNCDVSWFADRNPSVENIACAIYRELDDPVRRLGVELDHVSVWETQKTVCTYRGDH